MFNMGEGINVDTIEYLPLFYMPLPGKHNPLIIIPVENSSVKVNIELMRRRGLELFEVDEVLERYLLGFYQFLCDELGVNYGFRVSIDGVPLHRGFTYAVITNAIAKMLAGRLTEDLYKLLDIVDSRFGIGEYVTALRLYDQVKDAYIWRYGDEVVRLEGVKVRVKRFLGAVRPTPRNNVLDNAKINNLLTHLAGLIIISLYEALSEWDTSRLYDYANLLNSLWEGTNAFEDYSEYRKLTVSSNYLYVQDVGRVLLLEVELRLQGR